MSEPPIERRAGFWEAAKSIFWAFFGVRRRHHGALDALRLTPLQIVVAGILGGVVFVLVIVLVVKTIVMSHGAAN